VFGVVDGRADTCVEWHTHFDLLGGVGLFFICATINVMILHTLVSEEGTLTTIALESGRFSASATIVFTFRLIASEAFFSLAGMMFHVVVIVSFFAMEAGSITSEEPRDGSTSVIVFTRFDEDDFLVGITDGTLVNDLVIMIQREHDETVVGEMSPK